MGLHQEPDQGTHQPFECIPHATLMPVSSQLYHLSDLAHRPPPSKKLFLFHKKLHFYELTSAGETIPLVIHVSTLERK